MLLYYPQETEITHTVAWQTEILKARSGLEQRVNHASRLQSFAMEMDLTDAQALEVRSSLFREPAALHDLPLRHESMPAQADVTTNAVVIDITMTDYFAIGSEVVVENPAGDYWQTNITNATGANNAKTLTLGASPPVGKTFAAGVTRVIPVVQDVLVRDRGSMNRYAVERGRWPITLMSPPHGSVVGNGASLTTFDSLNVFNRPLSINGTAQEGNIGAVELVEALGVWSATEHRGYSDVIRDHQVYLGTQAEKQWIKKFYDTVRGRQVMFLAPTWRPDLLPSAQPNGTTSFVVNSASGYVANWFPSLAHRRLQINFSDGSFTYRKVNSCVDNGNGTQTLTLATSLSNPAFTTTISASFLEQVRFRDDELNMVTEGYTTRVDLGYVVVQR